METYREKFEFLRDLGFEIPEFDIVRKQDIPDVYEGFKLNRENLDYDIDGLVFTITNVKECLALGFFEEKMAPKGQVALKFPAVSSVVTIKDIEPSFEGAKFIGLIAVFDPVEMAGAEIRRASLKSYQWMEENNVGIGTVVELIRSGDVIPKIESVICNLKAEKKYPEICPECESQIVVEGAMLACPNDSCPAKEAFRLNHFLTKLRVKGLAHKSLLQYVKSGVILIDFVSDPSGEIIEEKIKGNPNISNKIWLKIKKQLKG